MNMPRVLRETSRISDNRRIRPTPSLRQRLYSLRWTFAAFLLAPLVLCVLPSAQIRLGASQLQGLVGSYTSPEVGGVPIWLTDLTLPTPTLPKTVQIAWTPQTSLQAPIYTWTRFTDASRTASAATGNTAGSSATDAFSFVPGTSYYYGVTAQGQLVIPATGNFAARSLQESVDLGGIQVTPLQPLPSDDQAVDSRLDPRYAIATNLDHNFGKMVNGQYVSATYRGGLYAGFISDNSRVGRSFLQFPLSPLPSGQGLWANVGNLYLYYTRSYDATATTVQALAATSAWSASTLTWDTAPPISPVTGAETNVVQTDPANPVASWERWHQYPTLLSGIQGASPISFGLLSQSESANGWAYFAKKEYNAAFAPCLLYGAGGYSVGVPTLDLQLNPSQGIVGSYSGVGGSLTFTPTNAVVILSRVAPPGGLTVTVSVSGAATSSTGQMTIPSGQFSAGFTLTSNAQPSQQHGSQPFTVTLSGPGLTTIQRNYTTSW